MGFLKSGDHGSLLTALPFSMGTVRLWFLAGILASSMAAMAARSSQDPGGSSPKQALSTLLSDFLKSHAETLVSDMLGSLRSPVPGLEDGSSPCLILLLFVLITTLRRR